MNTEHLVIIPGRNDFDPERHCAHTIEDTPRSAIFMAPLTEDAKSKTTLNEIARLMRELVELSRKEKGLNGGSNPG